MTRKGEAKDEVERMTKDDEQMNFSILIHINQNQIPKQHIVVDMVVSPLYVGF
jgi:hypothetical protein